MRLGTRVNATLLRLCFGSAVFKWLDSDEVIPSYNLAVINLCFGVENQNVIILIFATLDLDSLIFYFKCLLYFFQQIEMEDTRHIT